MDCARNECSRCVSLSTGRLPRIMLLLRCKSSRQWRIAVNWLAIAAFTWRGIRYIDIEIEPFGCLWSFLEVGICWCSGVWIVCLIAILSFLFDFQLRHLGTHLVMTSLMDQKFAYQKYYVVVSWCHTIHKDWVCSENGHHQCPIECWDILDCLQLACSGM